MHTEERCTKSHAQFPERKDDLARKQTPKKTKNSRRPAAKFVSIINTAVVSNAEVCVRPEEFDGTW
jgi:hypothetical protein